MSEPEDLAGDGTVDDTPLWEQQQGESTLWFGRFHAYMLLGSERSVLAAYTVHRRQQYEETARESPKQPGPFKAPSSAPSSWKSASKAWAWEVRADHWDAEQRRKAEEQWAERQEELRRDEWETSRLLLKRAKDLLAMPLFEREVEDVQGPDGIRRITTLTPAGWRQADINRFAKMASDLGRRATEMPSDYLVALGNLDGYSDEQLRKIERGEDPGPPEGRDD